MARPKGSKNESTVERVDLPRCPECASTESRVLSTNVQEYDGLTEDGERISYDGKGKPFNRVVRRRRQCTSCSRVWIVKTLEFVPAELPAEQDD